MTRGLALIAAVCGVFALGSYQVLGELSLYAMANLLVAGIALVSAAAVALGEFGRNEQPALRAPMWRALARTLAACAAATLVYLAAIAADVRFDWTFEGTFQLSEATVDLLGRVDGPVSLTLYYDEGDPRIRNTRLLLEEIARSGDQVKVAVRELADHPDEEDRYGIGSSNSVVVQAAGRWALVERPTEGALYEGLAGLVNARDTVIYVAVGAGEGDLERSGDVGFSGLRAALETEGYALRPLPLAIADEVPGDAAALLVLAPRRRWPETSLAAIERFLLRGGGLAVFLEPDAESGIESLLARFGIRAEPGWVIDPHSGAVEGEPLGRSPVASAYSEHPVTRGLDRNRMTFFRGARALALHKAEPNDRLRSVVLTSGDAWLDPEAGQLGPHDVPAPPPQARLDYHTLVATAELRRDGARSRIVVFGDADVASNRYLRALYNLDLVLNAVHWVSERESAIAIRPKIGGRDLIQFPVPLQRSLQAFYGAGLLIPQLLLLAAAVAWLRQRST